ncbi:MAG: hypothetical protein Q4D38_08725 [Planctomycetia bacterium]|nr:hypothetical protein [Planctomycetia bacterium]
MKNLAYHSSHARRGMTLIELLVVGGLMVLLISVSVPVLNPLAEGRTARETVRGINAALETAKARAMRLGRPCGVALVPFEVEDGTNATQTRRVCIQVEQITAPPTILSTCSVSSSGISGVEDPLGKGFKKGDRLQVNHTGPWFRYTGSSWESDAGFSCSYDLFDTGGSYDCTIRYAPVSESGNAFAKVLGLDPTFVLPRGTVIDLFYSGVGKTETWGQNVGNATYPPQILFYPDGSVSLFRNGTEYLLQSSGNNDSNIYLLVGRWDRGLSLAEDGETNVQDPNSFWIVVQPKSGLVRTLPNNAFGSGSVSDARSFYSDDTTTMGGR